MSHNGSSSDMSWVTLNDPPEDKKRKSDSKLSGFDIDVDCNPEHDEKQEIYSIGACERCCNLKLLIKQQQKELTSLKVHGKGVLAIQSCLEEERQENVKLRERIEKQQGALNILRNRLSQAGCSTSVSLGDDEFLLPGPSRQVFDNLIRENVRLRQISKHAHVDPGKVEETFQEMSNLKEDNKKLEERIYLLVQEIDQLKRQMVLNPSDKEAELIKLRHHVKEMEQNRQTQDILCQSLSEESVSLKQRLRETADMCHRYLQKLEEKEVETTTQKQLQSGVSGMSLSARIEGTNAENATLKKQNEELRARMATLDADLKKIVDMNTRWQSFHDQREQYMKKLQEEKVEMENRLARSQGNSLSEQQQVEMDRLLMQYKEKVGRIEEQKLQIEGENQKLRMEVQELRDNMNQRSPLMTREEGEHMELMKAQIKQYAEDFAHERQDRERAHVDINELKEENARLVEKLNRYERQEMDVRYDHRIHAINRYQEEFYANPNRVDMEMPQCDGEPQALVDRGIDNNQIDEDGGGYDEIDSWPTPPRVAQEGATSTKSVPEMDSAYKTKTDGKGSTEEKEDVLECPRCKKEYPASKHTDLLDHIELCCN